VLQATFRSIKGALAGKDSSCVRAVGVSGQQHGMVLLDADGGVVRNAKLWCDVEAAKEAAEISKASGHCYVRSPVPVRPFYL